METSFRWGIAWHEWDNVPYEKRFEMMAYRNLITDFENRKMEEAKGGGNS